jgi:hypothetical protein
VGASRSASTLSRFPGRLTLILVGVAALTGDRFPRWVGAWAAAAGLAYLAENDCDDNFR